VIHGSLLPLGLRPIATGFGAFRVYRFLDLERGQPALAVVAGRVDDSAPVMARVHSSCVTSEVLGACDCAQQLDAALAAISNEGRGVLFYLMQEGRGAGFVAKARDRMMVQASGERLTTFEAYERMGLPQDARSYREVADMREALGMRGPLRLLTNNPDKLFSLERAKVPVAGAEPLHQPASPFNRHYLAAKSLSGHAVPQPAAGVAELPEPVALREPEMLADQQRFARVAAYLLPVRGREPQGAPPLWLRLCAYYDLQRGLERVVLEPAGASAEPDPPRFIQRQRLLDRFPLLEPGSELRAWQRTRARLTAGRRGRVLLLAPDETAPVDRETRALLDRPVDLA
jgi:GTP cyclohydrolase II